MIRQDRRPQQHRNIEVHSRRRDPTAAEAPLAGRLPVGDDVGRGAPVLQGGIRAIAAETAGEAGEAVLERGAPRVGRRVLHGLPGYEQLMAVDYQFSLILDFDDVEGLKSYLQNPAHAAIGGLFTTAASASLAYDYEVRDLEDAAQLLDDPDASPRN